MEKGFPVDGVAVLISDNNRLYPLCKKLNMELGSRNSTPSILPGELKTCAYTNTFTQKFIAAFFIVAKNGAGGMSPLMGMRFLSGVAKCSKVRLVTVAQP